MKKHLIIFFMLFITFNSCTKVEEETTNKTIKSNANPNEVYWIDPNGGQIVGSIGTDGSFSSPNLAPFASETISTPTKHFRISHVGIDWTHSRFYFRVSVANINQANRNVIVYLKPYSIFQYRGERYYEMFPPGVSVIDYRGYRSFEARIPANSTYKNYFLNIQSSQREARTTDFLDEDYNNIPMQPLVTAKYIGAGLEIIPSLHYDILSEGYINADDPLMHYDRRLKTNNGRLPHVRITTAFANIITTIHKFKIKYSGKEKIIASLKFNHVYYSENRQQHVILRSYKKFALLPNNNQSDGTSLAQVNANFSKVPKALTLKKMDIRTNKVTSYHLKRDRSFAQVADDSDLYHSSDAEPNRFYLKF